VSEIDTNLLENKIPGFAEEFAKEILQVEDYRGDLSIVVRPDSIRKLVMGLKQKFGFEVLMDLFAMDYLKWDPPTPERFAVIYNFYSLSKKRRVRLKVFLNEEKPEIDSAHDLYASANWFEREAWDLFGINFKGHPHLKRILCHDDFEGHPLRKDYPSDGYQRLKSAIPAAGI
jgi:NADH-quinone oxidoreductase subunit C